MDNDHHIEYKRFTVLQGMLVLCVAVLFALLFGWEAYDRFFQEGIALGDRLFPLFGFVMGLITVWLAVRAITSGLRTVILEGQIISLVYPQDVRMFEVNQMQQLTVRRTTRKGNEFGKVTFEALDGEKYFIKFRLDRKGGTEIFRWFESIVQSKQTTT